jgi:hypothetical protein
VEVGAGADVELGVDLVQVVLDRLVADERLPAHPGLVMPKGAQRTGWHALRDASLLVEWEWAYRERA